LEIGMANATAGPADVPEVADSQLDRAPDRSVELAQMLKLHERREPLVVQVATWVGLGVIEGRLRPGQDLNSVDLSHRFNSSRTPVREALMLLEQEGLVEMRARRRPRVAQFSPERIAEIYQLREHLLELMGSLVAVRIGEADLDDLRRRVKEMRRQADSGEVDGYFWSHVALQERMLEIAGNSTLKGILDSLALRTLILRHASLQMPGRLPHSVAAQELILQAIEDHDPELTAMLLSRATRAAYKAIQHSPWTQTWAWSDKGSDQADPEPQTAPLTPSGRRRRAGKAGQMAVDGEGQETAAG
jgi:DNA-binding GntR family transcriptional regulator